jgi:hypothetical protein
MRDTRGSLLAITDEKRTNRENDILVAMIDYGSNQTGPDSDES